MLRRRFLVPKPKKMMPPAPVKPLASHSEESEEEKELRELEWRVFHISDDEDQADHDISKLKDVSKKEKTPWQGPVVYISDYEDQSHQHQSFVNEEEDTEEEVQPETREMDETGEEEEDTEEEVQPETREMDDTGEEEEDTEEELHQETQEMEETGGVEEDTEEEVHQETQEMDETGEEEEDTDEDVQQEIQKTGEEEEDTEEEVHQETQEMDETGEEEEDTDEDIQQEIQETGEEEEDTEEEVHQEIQETGEEEDDTEEEVQPKIQEIEETGEEEEEKLAKRERRREEEEESWVEKESLCKRMQAIKKRVKTLRSARRRRSPDVTRCILPGGVLMEDLRPGYGIEANKGDKLSIHYIGTVLKTKKVFGMRTRGKGLHFLLGKGEVIKGLEIGIEGMREGGRRRLLIPPRYGYGDGANEIGIPENAALEFQIELRTVRFEVSLQSLGGFDSLLSGLRDGRKSSSENVALVRPDTPLSKDCTENLIKNTTCIEHPCTISSMAVVKVPVIEPLEVTTKALVQAPGDTVVVHHHEPVVDQEIVKDVATAGAAAAGGLAIGALLADLLPELPLFAFGKRDVTDQTRAFEDFVNSVMKVQNLD